MKIPAIRGKIGTWDYYVTTLTFQQVSDYVSRVDDELHKSESLKDLIQRSITNNYISIKNYIINQPEVFFNSLVLAVYDDYPEWIEIEVKYDDIETYQIGLLDFPSKHKIFPVDGQHRVEGIKAALLENKELANTKISAIFIGHKNDNDGMKKTRRLFSTLNRYAKPVSKDDIIALDEDDSIAIVTRNLLEEHILFTGKRVTKSNNKAILKEDKISFTSIITLYECNYELLKLFRKIVKLKKPNKERDKKSLAEYLKFRPTDSDLIDYENMCRQYWSDFLNSFPILQDYLNDTSLTPSLKFRNSENGGNLLFRPISLLPFVQASIEIHQKTNMPFIEIFKTFSMFDFTLKNPPFKQVLWNDFEKTMIMGNQVLTKLILKYLFNKKLLTSSELSNLINKYSSAINYEGSNLKDVLKKIH